MRSKVVGLRFTEEQFQAIKDRAGIMSVSDYCRYLVLKEALRKHKKKEEKPSHQT